MADIKSAREIAQEKIDAMGEVTSEERLRWEYIPQGERLAAECLAGKLEMAGELSRQDKKAQPYIAEGAQKTLLANIGLPKNKQIEARNKKAMDALMQIKKDKEAAAAVFGDIGRIFKHYNEQGEQQRQQAYQSLKRDFSSRLQQAVEQQVGTAAGLNVNVESLPQFNEEWQRMLAHLDARYIGLLDEDKKKLGGIK